MKFPRTARDGIATFSEEVMKKPKKRYLVIGSKWHGAFGQHRPCLWFLICLRCKQMYSNAGYIDEVNLVCPKCGIDCEDAAMMARRGELEIRLG